MPVAWRLVQKEFDKDAAAFARAAIDAFKKDPTSLPWVTPEEAEHLKAADLDYFEFSVGKHYAIGATLAGIEPVAQSVFTSGWESTREAPNPRIGS